MSVVTVGYSYGEVRHEEQEYALPPYRTTIYRHSLDADGHEVVAPYLTARGWTEAACLDAAKVKVRALIASIKEEG